MVQLQNYLKQTNNVISDNPLPLLNSLFSNGFSMFSPESSEQPFKKFVKAARRSPQLMGLLDVIATDMISDGVEFKPVEKENGEEKVKKAETFWLNNKGSDVAQETIYDMLLNGIGYNWKGVINDLQLKEFCESSIRQMVPEIKEDEASFRADKMVDDLKISMSDKLAKKLRHVAASTVTIQTDENDAIGYIQRVRQNTKAFSTEEMLVFKLMPFDGRVYPFPPMEAIFSEVYLLWLITQNYVSFFENGGKPDNVFVLPKELAGSPNHKYLIETLKKYKKIQNKHGNLVFTGDMTIHELEGVEEKMDNKDLGLYMTGVIAMMYGIPTSRIPFLIGKASSQGDSGGIADTGYWRKISVWQGKMEDVYNRDLFIPFFGVKMRFKRGYLQDEVRETQNEMQKTSIAEQRINIGLWTPEEAGNYLNIDSSIVSEAQSEKKKRDDEISSGMLNQNLDTNDNVMKNEDAKTKAKRKQDTQNKNQQNSGGKKINP